MGPCWSSVVLLVGSEVGGTEVVASAFSTKLCAAVFAAAKVRQWHTNMNLVG